MTELKRLEDAVKKLKKSTSEFPIGAVCLDDFKPVEEKIKNMRDSLKHLNARLLSLKAQNESQLTSDTPEEDEENTFKSLQEATAKSHLNNITIKLCLHSYAIQNILFREESDPELKKKIYDYMHELFTLNDKIISLQDTIESAIQKQLNLKIECQNSLSEYRNFLKEQEELRNKRLQETNPEIARNKEKMNKTIQKINIMKKLITSFIAASSHMLMDQPILVEMLEKHRELINVETIIKMSQNTSENAN